MNESTGRITEVLNAWGAGEQGAFDELIPMVYRELKHLARGQLARNPGARPSLNTTGLVHEAYFKFVDQTRVTFEGRSHFFAIAARAMRQVLVDQARRRQAAKRGGGAVVVEFEERDQPIESEVETVLALEQALVRLGEESERCVRVVECRFFAGMSVAETAEALSVSQRTIERDWMQARGWLRQQLDPEQVAMLSAAGSGRPSNAGL